MLEELEQALEKALAEVQRQLAEQPAPKTRRWVVKRTLTAEVEATTEEEAISIAELVEPDVTTTAFPVMEIPSFIASGGTFDKFITVNDPVGRVF